LLNASSLYDIENLADLFDAYHSGMIDYGTFSVLYNAYDLGGLTTADLQALLSADRADLDFVLTQPDTTGFWAELLTGYDGRFGARRFSGNFDNVYGDYYAEIATHAVAADLVVRQEKGSYSYRRRSLSWSCPFLTITAGDYSAAAGYGLVIGRYDYRPVTGDNTDDDDFLHPDNNYYNGLKASAKLPYFESKFYYSDKEYGNYDKTFVGISGDIKLKSFSGGLSYGVNRLEDYYKRHAAGIHARYETFNYSLGGEYAVIEKWDGAYFIGQRKYDGWSIQSEFWHYGESFYNYNCSAPAVSDYETYYPLDDTLGFRSYQAGETGMALSYRSKAFTLGTEFWSHTDLSEIKSSFYFGYLQTISSHFDSYVQTSYRDRSDNNYFWLKTSIFTDYRPLSKLGCKLYFKDSEIAHDDCYVFFNLKHSLGENLRLSAGIREYFDGGIYYIFEESFYPAAGFIMRADISYKNTTRINIKIEKVL
jgi:hypothetical protein